MSQNQSVFKPAAVMLVAASALGVVAWAIVSGLNPLGRDNGSAETKVYLVQHVRPTEVAPTLAGLLPEDARVRAEDAQGRLLVQGSPQAHKIAQDTIRSLDQPGVAAGQGEGRSVLKGYSLPTDRVEAEAARLQQQYASLGGVRIAPDARSGQILVVAPPDIQSRIAAQLGDSAVAAVRPPTAAEANAARTASVESHTVQLQSSSAQQMEAGLAEALQGRLRPLAGATAARPGFEVALPGNRTIQVSFDRASEQVTVRGAGETVEAAVRLIRELDRASRANDGAMRLMSLRGITPESLHRTVAAVNVAGAPSPLRVAQTPPRSQVQPPVVQAPPAMPSGSSAGVPGEGARAASPPSAAEALGETALVGSVRVELLEGLDVLVIRGAKRDVDQVVEIINQIEKLSVDTEPAIEVYPLRNVDCQAMADLVTPLYDQVFSPRQGQVRITALVKPNALLLVGRPESVRTAIDLVQRLDQPVSPDTQFRVFQLRHAPAESAQSQIETFYDERGVLGTKLRVTADFRSNSLIVQAAPRDIAEVAELIARIDTAVSAAVNELRVFPLENSVASELAPILQEAVNAQASGQGGQSRQTSRQPGQPGQTTGQTSQAGADKATMLRFVTVDAAGRKRLNSGILTDVRITADTRANTLLVSAPADSMELIAALIRQMDKLPTAESQIKVFTVVNGDATSLIEMLEALFAASSTNQESGPNVRTGATEGESSLVSLRFAKDVRTNSIIASGNAGDLNVVEAILLRLDESDVRNRKNNVYRLKNAPVNDVANAINQFLTSKRQIETTTQGLYSAFEQIEREVVVVAEPVSNSLIVSATPRYYEEIRGLVEKLDERPPMVMIQVLIAEVKLSNIDEFGVELGLQDSLLFDRSLLENILKGTRTTQTSTPAGIVTTTTESIESATMVPGFNFNNQSLGNSGSDKSLNTSKQVGGQGVSSFSVGRTNSELGYGGLVLSASSESVSVLIRALQVCGRLEVLSRPQIMTLDNQLASIQVGQRVSLIRGTAVNEAGQTNQVTSEDVGLILRVTPRISPDGLVVMQILAEKSSLGPESEGTPVSISATGEVIRQPPINTTTAETVVAAMNGQTIILGGLITKSKEQVHRRVPLLSDIPILGYLFRYDYDQDERTELLIIMTPHVVKTQGDAEAIKQVEAARMHWCLSDVVKLHGDGGLRGRTDDWSNAETQVVYPDGKGQPATDETDPLSKTTPPHGELVPTPEGEPTSMDATLSPPLEPAQPHRAAPRATATPRTLDPATLGPEASNTRVAPPIQQAAWQSPAYPSTQPAGASGSTTTWACEPPNRPENRPTQTWSATPNGYAAQPYAAQPYPAQPYVAQPSAPAVYYQPAGPAAPAGTPMPFSPPPSAAPAVYHPSYPSPQAVPVAPAQPAASGVYPSTYHQPVSPAPAVYPATYGQPVSAGGYSAWR